MKPPGTLAALLEGFFTQRLMNQRQASPHTISSYRDTFRLLLQFAQQRLHKAPAKLAFEEMDAPLIAGFLDHLEKNRGITVRSRNLRLTAIRSFFHYAAYEEPSRAAQIQRVLAIPGKRYTRTLVHFLSRPEIDALLAAPDQQTWLGRRDHALLLVAVQTGLRLSELTGLQRADVVLGRGAHVRCVGKGRKERCTPLAKTAVAVLKVWLREPPKHRTEVLFPTARGGRLSPDSVADLLAKHVSIAGKSCSSLRKQHVTPHVLRHSTATVAIKILGKGQKWRAILFPVRLLRSIHRYVHMERRHASGSKNPGTAFVGRTGEPLKTPAINRVFSTNCKRTGLHIWPHLLRHAYAVERLAYLQDIGAPNPLKTLQLELGHASMATTEQYLHLTERMRSDLIAAHNSFVDRLLEEE